jgi:hypothetical protein
LYGFDGTIKKEIAVNGRGCRVERWVNKTGELHHEEEEYREVYIMTT